MKRTFSDNWYRVAELRVGLRPGVSIRMHHYREEPWYILHERAHNSFFRVNPATYRFLARLSVDTTLDEIWHSAVHAAPEETPGQEEVFELIAALYRANLIYIEGGVDESRILERFDRKKKKPFLSKISELLFLRVPLLDPEPWLSRNTSIIQAFFSVPARLLALFIITWGSIEFFLANERVWNQTSEVLQFDNLLLLYFAIFVSHALHELGHATLSKYFGGEVRVMGVMLLLFTPLPYVDLSSNWGFRNRYHRALVDAAGMMVDILIGAIATIIWVYSPPGMLNELAYNLMFTTVVYTVVFNINPLMRFDGYYILSDLIGIPNLHEQSRAGFMSWCRQTFLETANDEERKTSGRRQFGLISFFLASNIYRLTVMFGIVLFVADQYFGVGLLVALALAINAFIVPLQKFLAPLKNPLFFYQHLRFLQKGSWVTALAFILFLFMPVPNNYVLSGVLEAQQVTPLFTKIAGVVTGIQVTSGEWVEKDQLLVALDNPELNAKIQGVVAQIEQAKVQEDKAIAGGGGGLQAIKERLNSLAVLHQTYTQQRDSLTVHAPHAGYWVDTDTAYRNQSWVGRGVELGRVSAEQDLVFLGVIKQEAAASLSQINSENCQVKIEGKREQTFSVKNLILLPHSQTVLPSAALSPLAGGDVPISTSDPTGKQTLEPFFMLRAKLGKNKQQQSSYFLAGRSGWIKVQLPYQPLAMQTWRSVWQFVQRRYRI